LWFARSAQIAATNAALYNLGVTYKDSNQPHLALPPLTRVVEQAPDFTAARHALAIALIMAGRPYAAIIELNCLLALDPMRADFIRLKSLALKHQSRLAESIDQTRRLGTIDPNDLAALSEILVTNGFRSEIGIEEHAAQFRYFGQRLASIPPLSDFADRDRDPDRILHVGYVAPRLHRGVLAPNLAPVFEHHRADHVRVSVYAHVPTPDSQTRRMRQAVDHWIDIYGHDDQAVARRILADKVDILIQVVGHFADNRLGVFAYRPAPIQVTYLAQSLTSGMYQLDYMIADRYLNAGNRLTQFCTEKIIELPGGFQTTEIEQRPPIGPPPSIANGFITFGCFNNPAKISAATLGLWAKVLHAIPHSRLLIKGLAIGEAETRRFILEKWAFDGFPTERVDYLPWLDAGEYLSAHDCVDIALDTYPFSGGRTTFDALWMGVPTITLIGEPTGGRLSYDTLMLIGADELCAQTKN
jgi:predicted O-linked N-acetylglucosamine transferase (SPINDLY family)